MPTDVHAAAAARLKRADQRYTGSRRELVEVLAAAGRPLAIPDVLAARPGLPQSSVYRNLAVLEQAGAVRRVAATAAGADDFARYELAEDLTEHHHHLFCRSCGAVADVTLPATFERAVAQAVAEVARQTGFRPEVHSLDLVGLCAACA